MRSESEAGGADCAAAVPAVPPKIDSKIRMRSGHVPTLVCTQIPPEKNFNRQARTPPPQIIETSDLAHANQRTSARSGHGATLFCKIIKHAAHALERFVKVLEFQSVGHPQMMLDPEIFARRDQHSRAATEFIRHFR